MKWGGVAKKWKTGVKMFFFVKKWIFPQRRAHYVQYQYFFLFYILLIRGGGVRIRTQRTPLPTGLVRIRRVEELPSATL